MMIGKIVPYMVIALIDLVIIICRRLRALRRADQGQPVQFALFALLYLFCALGVGVFVSTIADTMQNAMLAAIFLSLLPSVLLSGLRLPARGHAGADPGDLATSSRRATSSTAIRGIYLKGVGLEVLWPEALLLLVFAVGDRRLSASRFQERLE